jgi:YVTN family beta-propeller protein
MNTPTSNPAIEERLAKDIVTSGTLTRETNSVVRSGLIHFWIVMSLFVVLNCVPAQGTTFVYVTDNVANTVSVIDTASNAVVITIPVGQFPEGVTIRPDGAFAYVANARSNTVSVISTINNRVVATVPVGSVPRSIAFRPDGMFAYVSNFGSDSISVIRTANNTVVATFPVGSGLIRLRGLTLTPDGAFAYVSSTSEGQGSVFVIDTSTNTIVATLPIEAFPLIVSPNGDFVYGASGTPIDPGQISVISTHTHTVVASIPGSYSHLAITPNGAFLYASTFGDDQPHGEGVIVIDTATNTSVGGFGIFNPINDLVMSPDGAFLFVLSVGWKIVSTATNTVVGTIPVDGDLRFSPDRVFAFVPRPLSHNVSIINFESNTLVATVPLSQPLPIFPSFTPDGAFAFVAPPFNVNRFEIVRVATNEFVASGVPAGVDSAALTPDIPWGYQDVSTMTTVSKSSFSQILFPQLFVQFVSVRNNTAQSIVGPITLTVNNLQNAVPVGNTLRSTMVAGADNVLSPGESVIFTLYFFKTLPGNITYTERVLSGTPPN